MCILSSGHPRGLAGRHDIESEFLGPLTMLSREPMWFARGLQCLLRHSGQTPSPIAFGLGSWGQGVGGLKSSLCGCRTLLQTGSVAGAPAGERVYARASDPSGRLCGEDCRQCLSRRTGSDDLEGNTTAGMTQSYTFLTVSMAHTAGGSTG